MTLPINWQDGANQKIDANFLNKLDALINGLPTPPRLMVAADNGWGTEALSVPTSTVGTSAYTFTMGMNVNGIVLKYVHAYMSGDFDIDPAGPITFWVSVSVLSSSNPNITLNTLFPVTFGGKKSVTLDPGGEIESDPLEIVLNAGDLISVRSFLSSGTAYPYRATTLRVSNGGGFTATTDLTAPGSAAVASTTGYYLSPASILGYPDPATKVTALGMLGDSIAFSGGDSGAAFSVPLLGFGAYGIRALTGRGGFVNLAYSGDTMANFLTTKAHLRRSRSLRRVNAVLCEYGVNDLAGGAYTAAQLQANILTAAQRVKMRGIKKFFIQTLTPRTTSTDGWATVANQTAIANDPARITHNTWVRAGCPIDPNTLAPVLPGTANALLAGSFGHPITGWIEMADLVESSRDSGLWKPCQRVAHVNTTSGSNVITLTDATFNTANIEAGGDNGACVAIQGWTTLGVWPSAFGILVTSTTAAATAVLAGQTLAGAPVNINPTTADGTHPTSSAYIAMAAALVARLSEFAN
jgi:lysophospholipase L1-like esterase